MAKAFLSHSSHDKKRYVEYVANTLGTRCIYDAYTFEEGMKNYEEIINGLDKSDLFVLFISDHSLNSDWVQKEIINSYDLLKKGNLQRIFPIIIDSKITYKDTRIPDWMRNEYNLQYISRPKLAARRIVQRLIEISWDYHPKIKEKQNLFVGRNTEVSQFEERFDSMDMHSPNCVFTCGLHKIGRKSFSKYALKKSNIIKDSYSFPNISLEIDESVEDFILKIYDLGFSEKIDLDNLMFKDLNFKITLVKTLMNDLKHSKEILQINDNGCLVAPSGELSEWFALVIDSIEELDDYFYFNIISKYRFYKPYLLPQKIYHINIGELDLKERIGLLKRYANLFDIEIDEYSLELFKNTLLGFPEQIFFSIDFIKSHGLEAFKENPNLIIEYNTEKVKNLVSSFLEDTKSYNLLALLAEFDFISIEFLNDFISLDNKYVDTLKELIISGICEHIGATKEYIRLNDSIKDYISRNRLKLPSEFEEIIKNHSIKFVENIKDHDYDLSEIISTVKHCLKNNKEIPTNFLVPSHFLKTINDLYDKGKKYNTIIELSDRVLANSQFMDKHIYNEILYMLCLSLARTGNSERFFREVHKLKNEDKFYLTGFYHRLSNNIELAFENINKFLNIRKNSIKGRRELVQLYIDIEDFEQAFTYAKEIYEYEKLNPYNILAYIRCLFKVKSENYKETIENLINTLKIVNSEISKEMYLSVKAEYVSTFDNNKDKALNLIDECISIYPDNPYPLLTKIEICEKYRLSEELYETLNKLKGKSPKANTYNNTINVIESKYLAITGNITAALKLVDEKLKNKLPKSAIDKLKEKLMSY